MPASDSVSDHADTIRRLHEYLRRPDRLLWRPEFDGVFAQIVAERQQLRTTIDYLLPANGCTTVDEAIAAFGDRPPEGYIVPEGDERCGFVMDACTCMKRKGHDGLHACARGGWR